MSYLRGTLLVTRKSGTTTPLRVEGMQGSVLFRLQQTARPTLGPRDDTGGRAVRVRWGRCDAHAISESSQTFLWKLDISVGGAEPVRITTTSTTPTRRRCSATSRTPVPDFLGWDHASRSVAVRRPAAGLVRGPEKPEDVVPFLENVTRGRGIPRERLEEVGEHYFLFGGRSPINDQNREFLAALREDLSGNGIDLPVYWGNRNWDPYLADTLAPDGGGRRHRGPPAS